MHASVSCTATLVRILSQPANREPPCSLYGQHIKFCYTDRVGSSVIDVCPEQVLNVC